MFVFDHAKTFGTKGPCPLEIFTYLLFNVSAVFGGVLIHWSLPISVVDQFLTLPNFRGHADYTIPSTPWESASFFIPSTSTETINQAHGVGKCWGYPLQKRFQVMFNIPKMGHLPNDIWLYHYIYIMTIDNHLDNHIDNHYFHLSLYINTIYHHYSLSLPPPQLMARSWQAVLGRTRLALPSAQATCGLWLFMGHFLI